MKKSVVALLGIVALSGCACGNMNENDGIKLRDRDIVKICDWNSEAMCENGKVLANGLYLDKKNNIYVYYMNGKFSGLEKYKNEEDINYVISLDGEMLINNEYDKDGNMTLFHCMYYKDKMPFKDVNAINFDSHIIQKILENGREETLSCEYFYKKIHEYFENKGINFNEPDAYQKAKALDISHWQVLDSILGEGIIKEMEKEEK